MMSNSMLFYDLIESGIYKNGHGITCKLPSSEVDRYYIFKAISKRYRRNFKKSKELSFDKENCNLSRM